MKKRHLKRILADARRDQDHMFTENQTLGARVLYLEANLRAVTHERDQMREHWAPKPIRHPWTPRNPQCALCEGPREDPRHTRDEGIIATDVTSDRHDSRCEGPECQGCR